MKNKVTMDKIFRFSKKFLDKKKDGKIVKTYTISTAVDYFKVNEDLTGFRKKVSPSLDGKFSVTDDKSPFVLKVENHKLFIHYTVNNVTFKETIEYATETELVITNAKYVQVINPQAVKMEWGILPVSTFANFVKTIDRMIRVTMG